MFSGLATRTDIIQRPDAITENLINANYEWKNTRLLSERDTTHSRLKEERKREGRDGTEWKEQWEGKRKDKENDRESASVYNV